ncbi:glycosyltransferase family 2 protein [Paracoccus indicus]|uniref:glycosyltransferase family 2 protein n=1 Tax=Paracoccus indicus TaxID=2079229 RepID=UPI000D36BC34|nr:glycosyltransferase family 2 protein [Paracoccus indicus]
MTTNPKLSIIVTSYNVQDYIAEAIESILSQSIGEIEVIVVDDGSTDGTVGIIKSYAELDDRVKPVLFTQNTIGGVASAANAGLEIATGDYIGFADGDDVYDSEMFGKMHRAAVKHDADLAMCQFMLQNAVTGERVDSDDKKNWEQIETITSMELDDKARRRILGFSPVPWRKIYRREMVQRGQLRFPVGDYFFEDNPFHWASVLSARNVVLLPEVLCYHRMARPGQTMSNVGPSLFKLFKHHDNIHNWLMQNGRQAYLPLLLEWVAKQNAWISEKALDEDLHLLLAELHPIVSQYALEEIEGLGFSKEGRTYKMLLAARDNDLDQFSLYAKQGRKKKVASPKPPVAQQPTHAARVDIEDIYFALMVIKKRIDKLEDMVSGLTEQGGASPEAKSRSFLEKLIRKVKG